jgi:hypothetical protein
MQDIILSTIRQLAAAAEDMPAAKEEATLAARAIRIMRQSSEQLRQRQELRCQMPPPEELSYERLNSPSQRETAAAPATGE